MIDHLHAEADGYVALELGAAAVLPVGEEVYFVALEHMFYVVANSIVPRLGIVGNGFRFYHVVAHAG